MTNDYYVTLSIPTRLFNKAKNVLAAEDVDLTAKANEGQSYVVPYDTPTMSLFYEDVREAELDFEHILEANNIPYDKSWEFGGGGSSGEDVFRVGRDGNGIKKTFASDTRDFIPLSEMQEAAEKGFEAMQEVLAKYTEMFSVIDWQEQMEILEELGLAD